MPTINTLDDFLQALDDNPAWRDAVRTRILGEDVLQLPAKFDAFVEEQRAVNEKMTVFIEEQRVWNRNATARFDRMEGDMSTFKDFYVSRQPFTDAPGIASDFGLEFVRLLTSEDLRRMAGNNLSVNVNRSFRNADMVIEGADETGPSYIVIEVSYTADTRDTDRAVRNAELITRFTGRPAQPVIASIRNDYAVQELIESGALHWYEVRNHAGRDTDIDLTSP